MKVWIVVLLGVLGLGLLLWLFVFSGWRTVYTLYLIARVSPFERVIDGAPTILVLGDSTAYGTGVTRAEESIAGLIAADLVDYSVQTRAGNGWNTARLRERLPGLLVPEAQYAAVVVQIGANDIIQDRPLADSQGDLEAIFSTLAQQTEHIVWLHSGDIGGTARFSADTAKRLTERTQKFRVMAKEVAQASDVAYVDLWREPEDDPIRQNPDRYIAKDGLHLTAAGYAHWYEKVRQALESELPPRTQ